MNDPTEVVEVDDGEIMDIPQDGVDEWQLDVGPELDVGRPIIRKVEEES